MPDVDYAALARGWNRLTPHRSDRALPGTPWPITVEKYVVIGECIVGDVQGRAKAPTWDEARDAAVADLTTNIEKAHMKKLGVEC